MPVLVPVMQKALTPAAAQGYLVAGDDRVAGYVVRAADVAFASTPAQLYEVHGLGYPGSDLTPDAPWVDVLRFSSAPNLQYREVPGYVVPMWWLRHSRITPGAEVVRVFADGTSQLLGRYGTVGTGWTSTDLAARHPGAAPLSRCVGPVARWHGGYLDADVVDDGRTVVLALASPPLSEVGFRRGPSGRWQRQVPWEFVDELFELDITARWRGLGVRVVDQWEDVDRNVIVRVAHLGDDLDRAERVGMHRPEPGVYEATVHAAELTDLRTAQIVPDEWTRGHAAQERAAAHAHPLAPDQRTVA